MFIPNAPGSWIKPENADVDDLVRIIESCPSGALSYQRKAGGKQEPIAQVNTARFWENGPVEYHGALKLPNGQEATRGRYVTFLDGIEAELTLSVMSPTTIISDHTGVPDALAGQGVGKALVEHMINDAKALGFRIVRLRPFVKAQTPDIPNGKR